MINFLMLFTVITNIQNVDIGLASVYNDKTLACPKSTYNKIRLPICASRDLPCGTILNIKRIDNLKTAQCVVADHGPYGVCIPSSHNSRACGFGSRWINGAKLAKTKNRTISGNWRGILDMSRPLARRLGVKNRLVPVFIWTDFANSAPSSVIPDFMKIPVFRENINDIDILAYMEMTQSHENYTRFD